MNTAYLLTGGNLDNREENLALACKMIKESAGIVSQASALYETAAWGKTDQPSFLNQALSIKTRLSPSLLLERLLEIERTIGRQRKEKYGPRLIDIDILLFDDMIIHEPGLSIPHPRMQERRFVLAPLAEIAADVIHPVFQKTVHQLLDECPDTLEVSKY